MTEEKDTRRTPRFDKHLRVMVPPWLFEELRVEAVRSAKTVSGVVRDDLVKGAQQRATGTR